MTCCAHASLGARWGAHSSKTPKDPRPLDPAGAPVPRRLGDRVTAIIPAPAQVLARAAWVPTLVVWHADGRFIRLERAPCTVYAAARRIPASIERVGPGVHVVCYALPALWHLDGPPVLVMVTARMQW